MVNKIRTIEVKTQIIAITQQKDEDYISLTDMLKAKDGDFFITDWMRNKNTLEFLSVWEKLYNPNFNYGEFAIISSKSGLNTFKVSVKEWVEKTNAIGITAKTGRYGGTYAHKDIAFEFASWISPTFKLYLIKEYQRLKEVESNQYNLEWNVKRVLSKCNYQLQTDAVKNFILPLMDISREKEWIIYAEEADILNVAMYGCTAKRWREANTLLAKEGKNIRDFASINELAVLSNLEAMNAEMIKLDITKQERFEKLRQIANYQLNVLKDNDFMRSLKRTSGNIYIEEQNKLKK